MQKHGMWHAPCTERTAAAGFRLRKIELANKYETNSIITRVRRYHIKMAKTESETIFEDYWKNAGIPCERIPEEVSKTPDYYILINGQKIVIEVKSIEPNKEEQEFQRHFDECCCSKVHSTDNPGNIIRNKIHKASPQIKLLTKDTYPGILILWESSQITDNLEKGEICEAMYGQKICYILKMPPVNLYTWVIQNAK